MHCPGTVINVVIICLKFKYSLHVIKGQRENVLLKYVIDVIYAIHAHDSWHKVTYSYLLGRVSVPFQTLKGNLCTGFFFYFCCFFGLSHLQADRLSTLKATEKWAWTWAFCRLLQEVVLFCAGLHNWTSVWWKCAPFVKSELHKQLYICWGLAGHADQLPLSWGHGPPHGQQ